MKYHEKLLLLDKGKAVSFYEYGRLKYGHVIKFCEATGNGIQVVIECDESRYQLYPEDIEIYERR